MNARCPECDHLFPRESRGRLLGGLWTPRQAACPSCGVLLQWNLFYWRCQILGGLLIVPALFRSLPGSTRLVFLSLAILLVLFATVNLYLCAAQSNDTERS